MVSKVVVKPTPCHNGLVQAGDVYKRQEDYYQREDDKPETVKRRLDVNIAQGEPIIAHYRAKGLVHDIEGNQDINDVFKDIEKVLTNLK